jgi:lysophospholipase L1-like esterase
MFKKRKMTAGVCRPAMPLTRGMAGWICGGFGGVMLLSFSASALAQAPARTFDDHQNMMEQLGVKKLRPGPDPNNQSTFDEATANPYTNHMPDALTMHDRTKVTRPEEWPARRAEIQEDFEREVYGRIPANVPNVTWKVTATSNATNGGIPTVTKTLVGHVDNSSDTNITVNIQASFTVPANTSTPVPMMIEFGGGFGFGGSRGRGVAASGGFGTDAPGTNSLAAVSGRRGGFGGGSGEPSWCEQAITNGWGHGTINPGSIQADNNHLTSGIIGLVNKGQPRKPDDWGALRAWQWGVSRLIDYFEAHPDSMVDATKIGVEGLSRYGKAALVTEAFEPRIAVGLIGSSGEGGAKLHRHIYGEGVENLAGGEYYWMAGNFIKYGAAEPLKTAADLPVDSHELIALCAPRPCFISYGIVEHGDAKWVDARGSFMAGILAGPVYRLLGKKDFGTPGNYLTDPLPPVNQLIGGELAWRQHNGGHEVTPNWPAFFKWVAAYVKAPALPAVPPEPATPITEQPAETTASAAQAINNPATAVPPPWEFSGGFGGPANEPAPRRDANSQLAHRQLVEKARRGGIDIYFEGDSITRRWGTSDFQYQENLANWTSNFFGWNAADFGWGADSTQNILWRLENGELDGVNPKIIVVLAGINNVGTRPGNDAKVEDITRGIKAILEVCEKKAPGATIVLTALFPRNDNMAVIPTINRINDNLAQFADGKKVRYLNVNDKLADKDGKFFAGMSRDNLHPTVRGYQVWADGLKPIFTELLGPPAKTDHAPPPTGDPGASGGSGATSSK